VCHASNNYPDLSSAASTLAAILAPCNVEIPDPSKGWDACERPADLLIADGLDDAFRSKIAKLEQLELGRVELELAEAPPYTGQMLVRIESAEGELVL